MYVCQSKLIIWYLSFKDLNLLKNIIDHSKVELLPWYLSCIALEGENVRLYLKCDYAWKKFLCGGGKGSIASPSLQVHQKFCNS